MVAVECLVGCLAHGRCLALPSHYWTGTASTILVARRHSSHTVDCAPGTKVQVTVDLSVKERRLTTLEKCLTF